MGPSRFPRQPQGCARPRRRSTTIAAENRSRMQIPASVESDGTGSRHAGPMSEEPRILDTREGYDLWAPTYDTMGNWLLALEEPEVDRALGPVTGLDLIDVGAGTGRHAIRLAAQGARVTAIDFSAEMLAKARAKAGATHVRFLIHDVTRPLPFADRSFDRVI